MLWEIIIFKKMNNLTDIAAERGILSAICRYAKLAYVDVRDVLTEGCFSHDNSMIYCVLRHILDKDLEAKIDLPLILSTSTELGLKPQLEKDLKYLTSLFSLSVELSNVRGFATKLRKLEEIKQLISKFDTTVTDLQQLSGSESMSEIVSIAEKDIFDFTAKLTCGNQQVVQIADGIDEYYEYLKNNRGKLGGIPIGFPKYEAAIGGIRTGVHVIGARNKIGKSYLALSASLYATYKEKIPVLYLDTELQRDQGQWDRFMARFGQGVTVDEIKFGDFFDNDIKTSKVNKAILLLKKLPLGYINVTGKDIDEIISIMRRWLMTDVGYDEAGKFKKCLIVYDYLKPPTNASAIADIKEWQEIGLRMGKLHDFTATYNLPILTFIQLNREHGIAASDRLGWYCTSYSTFEEKTEEEIVEDGRENGNRKLIPKLIRFGQGLDQGDYINFSFNGATSTIKELKTRNEITKEKKPAREEICLDLDKSS